MENRKKLSEQLGNGIRTVRKEKKLTQLQLAELTGIPRSLITRYELGTVEIGMPIFVTICDGMNVSPAYVLQKAGFE